MEGMTGGLMREAVDLRFKVASRDPHPVRLSRGRTFRRSAISIESVVCPSCLNCPEPWGPDSSDKADKPEV